MNKNVLSVFFFNKSKSFFFIKEFYCSFFHLFSLFASPALRLSGYLLFILLVISQAYGCDVTCIFDLINLLMSFRYAFSSCEQNDMATPVLPARPVLPIRCT